MSFRLTHARIAVMLAVALARITERATPEAAPAPVGSPVRKLERAAAMAKAHFADGHRKGILSILAEVLEVTPEERDRILRGVETPVRVPWKAGEIIIPFARNNGHVYPIGKPIIGREETDYCFRLVGEELEVGDHMDRAESTFRYATEEEVRAFFAELTKIVDDRDAREKNLVEDALLLKIGIAPKPVAAAPVQA